MGSGRQFHLRIVLERARSSLWLVPATLVLAAIGLSTGLLYLDSRLAVERRATQWWLFAGNAEGARTLLSVVASSLITVIAVAFSVTIIAIQQASTQFTPRVLRNYTKDRGNQIVLGTYIATFTYALLVLRGVRASTDESPAFVPTFSILGAMLLALASLGALIYFMHHVTESLQVARLLAVIREEVDAEVERMFPETFGDGAEDPRSFAEELAGRDAVQDGVGRPVTLGAEGYLRYVDERALEDACEGLELVAVPVQVGERLQRDTIVALTWPAHAGDALDERIRAAFQLDRERSTRQDVLFGIRQMVDIAVKALSPGVNDPTTAEQAVDELVGAVATILARQLPDPVRRARGGTLFLFAVPTIPDVVEQSFSQIRRAARTHPHVTLALLRGLRTLAGRSPSDGRRAAIHREVEQVLEALPRAALTRGDEGAIRSAAREVLRHAGAPHRATPLPDAERAEDRPQPSAPPG